MEIKISNTTLSLVKGDLTREDTDAIVNAANSSLAGGGGVDGAIHRAGGPRIMEECRNIGHCATGDAVITTGGNLKARYVIHTVGPVYSGGSRGESALLAGAYRSSLALARKKGLRTVAFPSISTGTYGYPVVEAALVALKTVIDFIKADNGAFDLVRFVLHSESDFRTYQSKLQELTGQ